SNTSWNMFEDDMHIIQFIQNEADFSSNMQAKLHESYGDQVIQLKTNKLSKGIVILEKIFSPDDEFKGEEVYMYAT
ncbi:hypothetical protein KI387_028697, partial [Taxus chinensis]